MITRDRTPHNVKLYHHPNSHSCDPGSSSHRADSDGKGEERAHKRYTSFAYPVERGEPGQYALRAHSELCGPLRSMDQMIETQECVLATDRGRRKLLPAQHVPGHQNWQDFLEVLEGKEGDPL